MPLKEKAVGSNRKTPKVTSLSFLYQKEKGMPCQPLHKAITQSNNFGDQDSVIARTHLDFPFMCKQQCFVFLKVAIYQHGKHLDFGHKIRRNPRGKMFGRIPAQILLLESHRQ